MEQTRLEKLLMTEVSGVDDPANQLPGWMVTKSAAPNKLAKIKTALGLGDSPGQEGLDMDAAELTALLDEREDALVEKVASALVSKSAPATGEGATEEGEAKVEPAVAPVAEAVPALTAETVAKAIEDGVKVGVDGLRADMTEVFEALISRFEKTEKHIGIAARTSLDGQEADAEGTEPVEKTAPDLGDAIAAALRR